MTVPPPTSAAVEEAARRVFAAPAYDWTEPSSAESWLFRQLGRFGDWLQSLNAVHPWLFRAVLYVIVAGLVLATLRGAWSAWRLVRSGRAASGAIAAHRAPHGFAGTLEDLERAAAAAAREGRYAVAMQLLWAAFDQSARTSGRVATGRSLTPRELVVELPAGAGALRPLVRQLYDVCYGGGACSREAWLAWEGALRTQWMHDGTVSRAA